MFALDVINRHVRARILAAERRLASRRVAQSSAVEAPSNFTSWSRLCRPAIRPHPAGWRAFLFDWFSRRRPHRGASAAPQRRLTGGH